MSQPYKASALTFVLSHQTPNHLVKKDYGLKKHRGKEVGRKNEGKARGWENLGNIEEGKARFGAKEGDGRRERS